MIEVRVMQRQAPLALPRPALDHQRFGTDFILLLLGAAPSPFRTQHRSEHSPVRSRCKRSGALKQPPKEGRIVIAYIG